jgi:hypothetical protein
VDCIPKSCKNFNSKRAFGQSIIQSFSKEIISNKMNAKFDKKYLYLPLRILLTFNFITLLLFVFGPVKWRLDDEWIVVSYLLLNYTLLYYGYKLGVKNYKNNNIARTFKDNKKIIYFILTIAILWFIPTLYIRLGGENFNFSESADIENILDPTIGYERKIESFESGLTPLVQYSTLLLGPFIYAFFPISIFYFKSYNKVLKFIIIIFFCFECLSWISIGTNKGIVDIFLISFFTFLSIDSKYSKLNFKKILLVLSSIILILFFFVSSMLSRYGAIGKSDVLDKLNFHVLDNPLKTTGVYADMDVGIKFAIMQIVSYLSQGYYNLALAFNEPFTWCYGFGNSSVGLTYWKKITGEDLMPKTYLGLIEKSHGVSSKVAWHSIYTWLASDFTFIGVPIIIFGIGYFFASSWLDTIYKRTIYANIVFCFFVQMVFYFYANNQVLSFTFVPFLSFFFLWRVKR